jgi:hypothetical protein
MERYLYKGKEVEVCDRFSSHWVYKEVGGDGVGKQGDPAHFMPVNPMPVPIPNPDVPTVVTQSNPSDIPGLPASPSEFDINAASLAEMKKTFKGKVGSSDCSKVFQRKPTGGYAGWDQLIEMNSDLGVNWEEVKLDLPIEVKF